MNAAKQAYADTVTAFMAEAVIKTPGTKLQQQDLFHAFEQWQLDNGKPTPLAGPLKIYLATYGGLAIGCAGELIWRDLSFTEKGRALRAKREEYIVTLPRRPRPTCR